MTATLAAVNITKTHCQDQIILFQTTKRMQRHINVYTAVGRSISSYTQIDKPEITGTIPSLYIEAKSMVRCIGMCVCFNLGP